MSHHGGAHWVNRVFDRKPPSTPLSSSGKSLCCADDRPDTMDLLEDGGFKMIQQM